jgi:hypothetical protein
MSSWRVFLADEFIAKAVKTSRESPTTNLSGFLFVRFAWTSARPYAASPAKGDPQP